MRRMPFLSCCTQSTNHQLDYKGNIFIVTKRIMSILLVRSTLQVVFEEDGGLLVCEILKSFSTQQKEFFNLQLM